MSYLIIDEDYKISKSDALSGRLRSQCKNGEISIVNLEALEGMNIDGTWSKIQEEPVEGED